eukprot:364493-Chlamydomonas_euryale.AAC.2
MHARARACCPRMNEIEMRWIAFDTWTYTTQLPQFLPDQQRSDAAAQRLYATAQRLDATAQHRGPAGSAARAGSDAETGFGAAKDTNAADAIVGAQALAKHDIAPCNIGVGNALEPAPGRSPPLGGKHTSGAESSAAPLSGTCGGTAQRTPACMLRDHASAPELLLVFGGLDTVADVYLGGTLSLAARNFHRPHAADLAAALAARAGVGGTGAVQGASASRAAEGQSERSDGAAGGASGARRGAGRGQTGAVDRAAAADSDVGGEEADMSRSEKYAGAAERLAGASSLGRGAETPADSRLELAVVLRPAIATSARLARQCDHAGVTSPSERSVAAATAAAAGGTRCHVCAQPTGWPTGRTQNQPDHACAVCESRDCSRRGSHGPLAVASFVQPRSPERQLPRFNSAVAVHTLGKACLPVPSSLRMHAC